MTELVKCAQRGDIKASNTLIISNVDLIFQIANKYIPILNTSAYNLEFTDLVQEGYIWLIKAIKRYDWQKRSKFTAYATLLIRKAMDQAIMQQGGDHYTPCSSS